MMDAAAEEAWGDMTMFVRQPVHTVYGGAHLFRANTAMRLGVIALNAIEEYIPDDTTLGAIPNMPADLTSTVHARVVDKLKREPSKTFASILRTVTVIDRRRKR